MADPVSTLLQKAIFAALSGSAFQTAIGADVAVYDRVPGSAQPPYIKIGDDQELGDNAQGYAGSEHHCTITAWTPGPGKLLGKAIANQVRTFLCPDQRPGGSAPFTLTGHKLVTWTFEGAQHTDDADGVSVRSVITVTFQTYPTA